MANRRLTQLLHRQDASLVSVRSWPEFIGTTSGYSYIKPKGDIAGARWGHAGSDSTHMEDFHNLSYHSGRPAAAATRPAAGPA
ncbi:hypothetical protein FK521_29745, partial [Klebsiella pneumoniae]|nr:hypothetical protein [Klebsiella pneumoniae]